MNTGVAKSLSPDTLVQIAQALNVDATILKALSLASEDDRRDIWEMPYKKGRLQYFLIKQSNLPLANHFHNENHEVFTLISGGGTILTAPTDQERNYIANQLTKHVVTAGSTVEIPTGTAHRFDVEASTEFVCTASMPFDAKDLIPCILPHPSTV